MNAIVNEDGLLEVYTEEFDICSLCFNVRECPLIAAIQSEVVILRYSEIEIEHCGLFERESIRI